MKVNVPTIFIASFAALIVASALYLSGGSTPKETKTAPESPAAMTEAAPKTSSGEVQASEKRERRQRTLGPESAEKASKRLAGPTDPSNDPNDTRPAAVKYSEFYQKPDAEQEIIKLASRVDMADDNKALALLNKVYTSTDEPTKVVAMEYATQLMSDEQFKKSKSQILSLNDTGSEDMQETILRDILTRAENVRMPALVDLLRRPPFPGQQEVREILEAYLDVDYGTDIPKWDAAVHQWLVENDEL